MARPKNVTWQLSHNPEKRPLGCNGRYGTSGAVAHYARKEPVCDKCKASRNHYGREARRGNPGTGRRLQPCGTNAAAKRHRRNGEELCLPCSVAASAYNSSVDKR